METMELPAMTELSALPHRRGGPVVGRRLHSSSHGSGSSSIAVESVCRTICLQNGIVGNLPEPGCP
jgi:hypothetical protein